MRGKSLGYLTKEGFRNLWVNRLMSLASIAVLMSCLFMVGCASMIFLNIDLLLDKMEDENVIIAFVLFVSIFSGKFIATSSQFEIITYILSFFNSFSLTKNIDFSII